MVFISFERGGKEVYKQREVSEWAAIKNRIDRVCAKQTFKVDRIIDTERCDMSVFFFAAFQWIFMVFATL